MLGLNGNRKAFDPDMESGFIIVAWLSLTILFFRIATRYFGEGHSLVIGFFSFGAAFIVVERGLHFLSVRDKKRWIVKPDEDMRALAFSYPELTRLSVLVAVLASDVNIESICHDKHLNTKDIIAILAVYDCSYYMKGKFIEYGLDTFKEFVAAYPEGCSWHDGKCSVLKEFIDGRREGR